MISIPAPRNERRALAALTFPALSVAPVAYAAMAMCLSATRQTRCSERRWKGPKAPIATTGSRTTSIATGANCSPVPEPNDIEQFRAGSKQVILWPAD
jgi:hypothetical protein